MSVFSGLAIRRRCGRGCVFDAGDVSGNSDVGLCGTVLGACAGGGLPGIRVCRFVATAREFERVRGLALGAGRGIGRGVGDGDGISGGSGVGDAGLSRAIAGMVARKYGALASRRWRGSGCGHLLDGVDGVFARGFWRVSSELFVLRSEFVFVYATAGVHGADVSASGPAAEDSVWMFARAVVCVAGAGGGSMWIVAVVERQDVSRGGFGGGGDCGLLLLV